MRWFVAVPLRSRDAARGCGICPQVGAACGGRLPEGKSGDSPASPSVGDLLLKLDPVLSQGAGHLAAGKRWWEFAKQEGDLSSSPFQAPVL